MKKNIFNICMLTMVLFSCKVSEVKLQGKHSKQLKYVYKTQSDCKYPPYNKKGKPISDFIDADTINTKKISENMDLMRESYKTSHGYRIYLKYPKLPEGLSKENVRGNFCNYYWNQVFFYYSHNEQIALLEELLDFRNDTDTSGIKVYRYREINIPKPKTEDYTMQTDALYLFTNLVMGAYSPEFAPYPILINKETGEEINNDQEKIKEVFDLYKAWLEDYKVNGAENLLPPLTGTKFQWYGSNINLKVDQRGTDFNKVFLKRINAFPDSPWLDTLYY